MGGSNGRTVTEDGVVITAAEVEQRILALSDSLEELTGQVRREAEARARAEHLWKLNRAKTRTQERIKPGSGPGGRKTVDEVDDKAMQIHEALYLDYKLTESMYEATRDAMFTIRTQIDALRTVAANIRAQT